MFLDVPNNVSILTYYVVSKFFNEVTHKTLRVVQFV